MSFSERYAKLFTYLLPSPFAIAIVLTFVTFFIAWIFTTPTDTAYLSYGIDLLEYWEQGIWNSGLMVFALQMMLMLVLGHVLALSPFFSKIIDRVTLYANSTAKAAFIVTLLTLIVSLFNWGLGLIFGAILARKVGEFAKMNNLSINYALVGAAGYSGLMVWHGGISGSSLTKVAEEGHIKGLMEGIYTEAQMAALPELIAFDQTVFSTMNITVSLVLLLVLPISMYLIGRKSQSTALPAFMQEVAIEPTQEASGAERIDRSKLFAAIFGLIIIGLAAYKAMNYGGNNRLGFITPNFINFTLLGLGICLHGNLMRFLKAVDEAIGGAAGILIQFPLYFGIMGIMKSSGLVVLLSDFFVSISTETTFPIFTLFSAGIVNVFVPSGGGQWAVQGPIIIQAAQEIGVSLPKSILALAYGDQLTNMLQPFWALPLLGITGLKAKQILPYTLFLMLIGGLIYLLALLLF